MLRIVQLLSVLDPASGGPSRCVLGLSRALAAQGAKVNLIAGGFSGKRYNFSNNVVSVEEHSFLYPRFGIPSPSMTKALWHAIDAADVVHLNGVWTGVITQAGLLGRLFRKPMVLSPHGMLDAHNMKRRRRFKQWYFRLVEQGNLNALAGFHFLDETEHIGCDWLQPTRELPSLVQPNGIDLDALTLRLDGLPNHGLMAAVAERGARHIVFLGRLNVIKGLELQLEVLADVRSAGQPVHLHWIGPDDGEWPKLQELAATLGVIDALHWHGPMYGDERLQWLQAADVVLLTSHYECNSVMAAEAMAVGGALLATDTCHVDRPGLSGAVRLVPRDRHCLGMALLDLLRDEHAAQRLRTRALAFARSELDWQPLAQRMIGFYETLIKSSFANNVAPAEFELPHF